MNVNVGAGKIYTRITDFFFCQPKGLGKVKAAVVSQSDTKL